tara:strand:- start:201 stop:425 length:225 start_codon:yes stop_codon:yes gene_type:complete
MSKKLIFNKINYIILLVALAVITLGFIIMGMDDTEYGFGAMGLTVAPIVVLTGFGIVFAAIFYKQKENSTSEEE